MPLPLCWLLSAAHAFAPTADPGEPWPLRTPAATAGESARLRYGAAWSSFAQGEGQGWVARFDARTGLARSAFGPPIDLLGGTTTADDEARVVDATRAFLARHQALLGVATERDLVLRNVAYDPGKDLWLVSLGQRVGAPQDDGWDATALQGSPVGRQPRDLPPLLADADARLDTGTAGTRVDGAGVELRIARGRLVQLLVSTVPSAAAVPPSPTVGLAQASEVASAALAPVGPTTWRARELRITTWDDGQGGVDTRLVWSLWAGRRAGLWQVVVDATTGQVLHVLDRLPRVSGTVYGLHDTRTIDGALSTSVIRWADVANDDDADRTAEDGTFTLDGADALTVLEGTYVEVRNDSGAEGTLTVVDGTNTWQPDVHATPAEIDSYVFLHRVYDWAALYAPDLSYGHSNIRSNVNDTNPDMACNAYFDGNVNFAEAYPDWGCNNTGRIADVNYHEWGHGLHYYSVESGSVDGTVGEGAGDVLSALQTHDDHMAPYFFEDGSPIRDLSNHQTYPDDLVGESHADSVIFSGAVWDLLGLLTAASTEEEAYATVSQLFADALHYGPELVDTYDAFVLADDDDGDLSNGTPHLCAIYEAFDGHGLGPAATGGVLAVQHTPFAQVSGPALIEADYINQLPGCLEITDAVATVYWSVNGVDFAPLAATLAGSHLSLELPEQAPGTVVSYYIEVEASGSTSATAPSGGVVTPYTYVTGELEPIACFDFEADDGGFTHELLDGVEEEGADDWMWGSTTGRADDPTEAASGVRVWANDLGMGRYNGEYKPEIQNILRSPAIDVTGRSEALVLVYNRWLQVEDATYDHADILVNDASVWRNRVGDGDDQHREDQWRPHAVRLPRGSDSLTLAWQMKSDEGLEFGGWTLDDVCVYAVSGTVDTGEPDSGLDTALDTALDTGGPDDSAGPSDTGDQAAGGGKDPGGCGCAAAGRPGAAWLVVGLAALAVRRRRGPGAVPGADLGR